MATTAVKIPTLNVVDIDTSKITPDVTPGMAGVAVLNSGSEEGLQTYTSPEAVEADYDASSYIYKFASAYFAGAGTTTFQVITYNPSAASASVSDPYKFSSFKSAITGHLSGTTSDSMYDSIKANFGSLFATGDKNVNAALNAIGTQFASAHPDSDKVNGDLTDLQAALNALTGASDSKDSAVNALIKYYDCGAEYFVFLVNKDNESTAIALSNEVEAQSEHNLLLDIPTTNSEPDFSWLAPIKGNLSTTFFSLPFSGDISDYQFVSAVLAQRAPEAPSADLMYVHDLPGVTPQDKYNFTSQDLDTYYKPFGVITYCYRNERPMLSSGNSADGYQMSNVVTRDYLNQQVEQGIANLLTGAHDSGSDIHFDEAGVNQIQAEIAMILNSAKSAGYIASFTQKNVDITKIPASQQVAGKLTGLGYTWAPTNNINGVVFDQGIVLPQLATK